MVYGDAERKLPKILQQTSFTDNNSNTSSEKIQARLLAFQYENTLY